jgi:hypothetical protein
MAGDGDGLDGVLFFEGGAESGLEFGVGEGMEFGDELMEATADIHIDLIAEAGGFHGHDDGLPVAIGGLLGEAFEGIGIGACVEEIGEGREETGAITARELLQHLVALRIDHAGPSAAARAR